MNSYVTYAATTPAALLNAWEKNYNPDEYQWGQFIPTYGFNSDPLYRDCLGGITVFSSTGCEAGPGYQIN